MSSFDWRSPATPWMAKLDRAQAHIGHLGELVSDFLSDTAAYSIEYEPGDRDETHLRITEARTIPIEVSTVLGDAVHNLRSSLDTVAYELARISHGGTLVPEQESLPEFPIRDSPKGYVEFFARRKGLFDEKAKEALHSVVPGHRFDALAVIDGEPIMTFQQEVVLDPLWQLHRLSIIDKHRRLGVVALWPDDVYWLNHDGQDPPDWRWGSPPFATGAILGTLIGGTLPRRENLTATMEMRLFEPSVLSTNMSLVKVVQRFADYIRLTVLPRIWQFY